jgi:AcrR family transcriptional regulator
MTTKEKILAAALHLFNTQGIESITTRHIAKEINISHGNLCYHYPKKEDIIYVLYQNLVKELDKEILRLQTGEPSLESVMRATALTFQIQYKYKFLLLDMVGIMRRIEPIRLHFRELFVRRKAQFMHIINYLVAKGWMREEFNQSQYGSFIAQFYIIGDFWISEAEILFEGTDQEKLTYYTNLAFNLIIPYFTPEGLSTYEQLHNQMHF